MTIREAIEREIATELSTYEVAKHLVEAGVRSQRPPIASSRTVALQARGPRRAHRLARPQGGPEVRDREDSISRKPEDLQALAREAWARSLIPPTPRSLRSSTSRFAPRAIRQPQQAKKAGGYERIPPRSGLVHELIKDHSQLERDIWERVHKLTQEVDAGYALLMTDEDGTLLVDEGMGFEARDPNPEKDGWTLCWCFTESKSSTSSSSTRRHACPSPPTRRARAHQEDRRRPSRCRPPAPPCRRLRRGRPWMGRRRGFPGMQAFGKKQNIKQQTELHKYLPRWKGMEEILAGEIPGFALAECVDQEIRENTTRRTMSFRPRYLR